MGQSDLLIAAGAMVQLLAFAISLNQVLRIRSANRRDRHRATTVELGIANDLSHHPEHLKDRIERLERLMQEAFDQAGESGASAERRMVREVSALRQLIDPLVKASVAVILLFALGLALITWGSLIA